MEFERLNLNLHQLECRTHLTSFSEKMGPHQRTENSLSNFHLTKLVNVNAILRNPFETWAAIKLESTVKPELTTTCLVYNDKNLCFLLWYFIVQEIFKWQPVNDGYCFEVSSMCGRCSTLYEKTCYTVISLGSVGHPLFPSMFNIIVSWIKRSLRPWHWNVSMIINGKGIKTRMKFLIKSCYS